MNIMPSFWARGIHSRAEIQCLYHTLMRVCGSGSGVLFVQLLGTGQLEQWGFAVSLTRGEL